MSENYQPPFTMNEVVPFMLEMICDALKEIRETSGDANVATSVVINEENQADSIKYDVKSGKFCYNPNILLNTNEKIEKLNGCADFQSAKNASEWRKLCRTLSKSQNTRECETT